MSYDSYIENLIETRRLMNNIVGLINYQERNMRIVLNNTINSRNTTWNTNNSINNPNDTMFYVNNPFNFSRNPHIEIPNDTQNRYRYNSINVNTPIYNDSRRNNISNTRNNTINNTINNSRNNSRNNTRNNTRNNAPSQNQISRATNNTIYSDIENPSNSICPISRDLFNDNDNVTQIIPCGHIFSRNNLREWFTHNSGCPMCRYDIRNYNPNGNSNVSQTPNNSRQTTVSDNNFNINLNDIAEQIADDILNNVPDSSNNISLEYSLYSPYNSSMLVPIFNRSSRRTTIDPSLNIL